MLKRNASFILCVGSILMTGDPESKELVRFAWLFLFLAWSVLFVSDEQKEKAA